MRKENQVYFQVKVEVTDVNTPPAIRQRLDAIEALVTEDAERLERAIARIIDGGIKERIGRYREAGVTVGVEELGASGVGLMLTAKRADELIDTLARAMDDSGKLDVGS